NPAYDPERKKGLQNELRLDDPIKMRAGVGGQHRMARPYSQDLRDRVVGSVVAGRSCRTTAVLFGVCVASVVKWSQRYRASGSAAAKPMGGHRRRILRSEREWLLGRITEKPDLTLRAVLAELVNRGMVVSHGALGAFFAREGITLKKSLHASEQDHVDVARRRARWRQHQGRLDPRRLVFIDETWAKDQHDPPPRALRPRHPAGCQGAARPL